MNPYLSPRSRFSFGAVVTNEERTEILLREPTNHHNGFVWTFAKGMPEAPERPEETALRESQEEYGWEIEILQPIPHWFAGPQWANYFFLAQAVAPRAEGPCWETASVRWFSWEEARDALALTVSEHRRIRDFEILAAAQATAHDAQMSQQPLEWTPPSLVAQPASGYAGYLQSDLQDFWAGVHVGASSRGRAQEFLQTLKTSDTQIGDPLLLQAFFFATATLLRSIRSSESGPAESEPDAESPAHWVDSIARGGIRRAFRSTYGGPLTGSLQECWDPSSWCQMAASWVPDCILQSDHKLLADWCESIGREIPTGNGSASNLNQSRSEVA